MAAITDLPVLQREAFLMQAEGEMSLDEIALATGSAREAVKSRLRYAMRRLRTALAGHR
jgi:RNA polymerase sigma-70 factor (ECF subfamily)